MPGQFKPPPETLTPERCYIREFLNSDTLPDVSLASCRVRPGVTTQLHTLTVHEWYLVESGRGHMRVGNDEPYGIEPGDTVFIPAGCEQQVTNCGESDLLFFCVCVPRFTPSCYTSLE